MVLDILGRCIDGTRFSTGKRCMGIPISSRQIDKLGTLSSESVTGCGGWGSGQRWRHLWSWLWARLWSGLWSLLFASVGWRWTCSFASPACLRILCGAIPARQVSGHVILMKHSGLSFYHSLHCFIPRKLNTPLLLFLDFGARLVDWVLWFFYCGVRKPSFRDCGHVQGQAHVELFQLYTTSLPCHRSRHVEYLQEIDCCFKQWDGLLPQPYTLL